MAKQLTEDELNLRRKARRRLIGAVALTLAVVVILPMVLDSEPKPTGQDIELRIPAPDKVSEFVPGVAVSEGVASEVAASKVPVSKVTGAAPLAVSAVETVSAVPAAPAEAPAKPLDAAVPAKPLAAAEQKPATAPPAVSKAAAPKKPDEPASAESFVAQVGAYASADTAKQELDKLKKLGFRKAYIERVGDKTRVRVGPYAEREKAEQVRQMLEKHGLKPAVMSAR